METFKKNESTKERSFVIKAYDSEGSDLDDDKITLIIKNFQKFSKKEKGYDNKELSKKQRSNDKSQFRCIKYEKTDHMIKYCSLGEIE